MFVLPTTAPVASVSVPRMVPYVDCPLPGMTIVPNMTTQTRASMKRHLFFALVSKADDGLIRAAVTFARMCFIVVLLLNECDCRASRPGRESVHEMNAPTSLLMASFARLVNRQDCCIRPALPASQVQPKPQNRLHPAAKEHRRDNVIQFVDE